MKMVTRILAIARKEFIQIFRDPRTLYIVIFIPMIQLVLFGFAVTFDVKHLSTALYDLDKNYQARQFISRFQNSSYFDINYYVHSYPDIERLLSRGLIKVAIVLPPNFSANLAAGKKSQIQIIVDGSDSTTASVAVSYINAISRIYSVQTIRTILREMKPELISAFSPIDYRPRILYNPQLRSVNFFIPGLMGIIMMLLTVVLPALAIVREKEKGTAEQLIVTPIKPHELILGKLFPFIILAYCDIILILLTGTLIFGVPVKGSILLLLFLSGVALIAPLGIGLFLSTVAKTQQSAMILAFLASLVPSFILSGFVFPINSMPKFVQYLTYLVPARYYLVIIRGIILKGVGLSFLREQVIYLVVFGLFMILISSLRVKKRL